MPDTVGGEDGIQGERMWFLKDEIDGLGVVLLIGQGKVAEPKSADLGKLLRHEVSTRRPRDCLLHSTGGLPSLGGEGWQ